MNALQQLSAETVQDAFLAGMLVPQPHQIEAAMAAVQCLSADGKAKVIMACGTGKTLVGAMVAQQLQATAVVVFTPSIALLKQTMDVWLEQKPIGHASILCVCSDDTIHSPDEVQMSVQDLGQPATTDPIAIRAFLASPHSKKVVFSTYHSAETLGKALPDGYAFEVGIFDEAHRTAGSEGKGFGFALTNKNIPIQCRLFLTATPKQFDSDRKTKDGDLIEVRSMDDEAVYGKVAYKLSFLEAVRRNLIVDFKVVVSVVVGDVVKNDLLRNGLVEIAGSPVALRNAANLIALRKCANELGLSKAFTFHESIKSAQHFAKIASEIQPIEHTEVAMKALHVNGAQSSQQRLDILTAFDQANHALLSNVRCLTEGVDVPEVDMVAFMSPKGSTQEIVQACGRAMRKAPGKSCGYIFLPILIELGLGESVETALQRAKLGPLWDVLEAMTECDESIYEALTRLRRGRGNKRHEKDDSLQRRLIFQGPPFLLEDIRRAVTSMAVTKLSSTWDEMYGMLQAYVEQHGHADVPANYKVVDVDLGGWVVRQRSLLRLEKLLPNRKHMLDQIQFKWDLHDDDFEDLFSKLQAFQAINGHCDVRKTDGQKLFSWVTNLRRNREVGTSRGYLADPDRIDRLNRLGFKWQRVKDERFEARFRRLQAHYQKQGFTQVDPATDPDLYLWVGDLRKRRAGGNNRYKLSQETIDRLDAIGFVWSFKDKQWEEMFEMYASHVHLHGQSDLSMQISKDGRSLLSWVNEQRKLLKSGALSRERQSRLDAIGFVADPLDARWEVRYREMAEYAERFGDCHIPRYWPPNAILGRWVTTQRSLKRAGELLKDRESKLNAIGFVWSSSYKNAQHNWQTVFTQRAQAWTKPTESNNPQGEP